LANVGIPAGIMEPKDPSGGLPMDPSGWQMQKAALKASDIKASLDAEETAQKIAMMNEAKQAYELEQQERKTYGLEPLAPTYKFHGIQAGYDPWAGSVGQDQSLQRRKQQVAEVRRLMAGGKMNIDRAIKQVATTTEAPALKKIIQQMDATSVPQTRSLDTDVDTLVNDILGGLS